MAAPPPPPPFAPLAPLAPAGFPFNIAAITNTNTTTNTPATTPLPSTPGLREFIQRVGRLPAGMGFDVSGAPDDDSQLEAFVRTMLDGDDSTMLAVELERVRQEEALEARRWRPVLRHRNERDALVQEALAMPRTGPSARTTMLTVDSGNPAVSVGASVLSSVPNLESLDLKAGWSNWEDFTGPPATYLQSLRKCSMTFNVSLSSVFGLEPHWGIFAHPTLESLTINQIAESAEPSPRSFMDHINVAALKGTTRLQSLTLVGVDVLTLSRALEMPRHLRVLKWTFTTFCPFDVARMLIFESTSEMLDNVFQPIHNTLETMEFQHGCLSNYKWGKFTRLETLRVHEEHFFPYNCRIWGDLKVDDLIPANLRRLEIRGCKFGKSGGDPRNPVDDRLLASLTRLANEVLKRRNPFHGTRLNIGIVLDPSSTAFPNEVLNKYQDRVVIRVVSQTSSESEDSL